MENGKGVWEYLRIATPVLTTLGLFIIGYMGSSLGNQISNTKTEIIQKVDKLDDKLFRHLTNDEMHTPRSIAVDKNQFELINQMRSEQITDLRTRVECLKDEVKDLQREVENGSRTSG